MNRDFVAGFIGLLIAMSYYAMALNIQNSQLADDVGPGGLPKIYGMLLAGFSIVLMLRARFRPEPVDAKQRPVTEEIFAAKRGLGILLIGVAYILAVPYLGYPLAIAVVIAVAALYNGGSLSLRMAGIAVLGAFGLWFVFVFLLHIGQPAGIWPDLIEGLRR
jgi:FtsH-binding integral membrane protein